MICLGRVGQLGEGLQGVERNSEERFSRNLAENTVKHSGRGLIRGRRKERRRPVLLINGKRCGKVTAERDIRRRTRTGGPEDSGRKWPGEIDRWVPAFGASNSVNFDVFTCQPVNPHGLG